VPRASHREIQVLLRNVQKFPSGILGICAATNTQVGLSSPIAHTGLHILTTLFVYGFSSAPTQHVMRLQPMHERATHFQLSTDSLLSQCNWAS
jgi:hypothetical protein